VFRTNLPIVVNWVYNNPISKGHFNAHRAWYKEYTNATYLDLFRPVALLETIQKFEAPEEAPPAELKLISFNKDRKRQTKENKNEEGGDEILPVQDVPE
jgi:hypothetical protein